MGRMLDFAVYELQYEISNFFELFISSGVAARFEKGDYSVIVGMSGVELAYYVLEKTNGSIERIKPNYTIDRSEEYWTGWALAYYQWETALKFEDIIRHVPITKIVRLYSPYQEMDIRHFCDKMNELYRSVNPETNLKRFRQKAELSQKQLAELSGVPLRTIQQYEQRQKNINKAQVKYLVMLARTLYCSVEDLIEKTE